ncbi:MAG TPA: APC family permease [Kofleriaceae bacterium]|nr:APC family permease [Kofleriaceae bacterium]
MAGITTTGSRATLLRILGVGFGAAVNIGSTIGIGILAAPRLVAGQLHDTVPILVAWLVGGLYTLLGAICLTELGTLAPQAGGYYVYARRAFGDRVGFAVGWTDWITYCSVLGYVSIGMTSFLEKLVPSIAGHGTPVAIALLVGFVGLQWAGVRISSRFQEWTTALKCLAFLALVVAGLVMAGAASGAPAQAEMPALTLSGVVGALSAVVITYAGWQSALYFTEEDRDPARNLPRAMIGGVVAVIAIYLLVNIALLVILPIPTLASSALPASDAAQAIVGPRGSQIITILCVVSLVPLLNAIMMIGTRILFALGRDGLLWSRAAEVNTGGTPGVATIVTTLVAVALIATGTFERLVAMTAFFLALNYAVCCLALVVLRVREPDVARPFRAWGYPVSAAIVVLGAIAFLVGAILGGTSSALIALGLLAVGLIGHAVHRAVRS